MFWGFFGYTNDELHLLLNLKAGESEERKCSGSFFVVKFEQTNCLIKSSKTVFSRLPCF